MTKINSSAPPATHAQSIPSKGVGVQGTAASAPAPGASTPKPSGSAPAPGQTNQFSAPKPKYSDPYAQGKPPTPQQQASYNVSTKSLGFGGSTKAPAPFFLKQPKVGPDSKLCAYYAMCHLKGKELNKEEFIKTAAGGLQQAMEASGLPQA